MQNTFGSGGSIVPFIPLIISNSSVFKQKEVVARVIVGVSCSLSITGSLLIILSYFLQKNRTKAREILFNISLMDFGVGMANLIGISINFDQYYIISNDGTISTSEPHINDVCKTQAFFAMFCTLVSVFWTTALAMYLYIVILHHNKPLHAVYFVRFSYIICYGLPLGVTLWACLTARLGYAPFDSTGYCSLITIDPSETNDTDLFAAVFGYDLWMYLAGFLIIVSYVAIKCFLSYQVISSNVVCVKLMIIGAVLLTMFARVNIII